jgi:steroid delta-isomerase-like uncharacterized protein
MKGQGMNTIPETDRRAPVVVVAEFFDAMARRDIEAAMDLVSDDIVEDLAGVGVISGLAEERAFLTAFFGSFPDMQTEVVRVTAQGRVVAVEWRRRGTFTGTPWQGLPASGRPFDLRGAAFAEVDDGLISYVTVYSDSAQLGRDLGILPPAGSPAERVAAAIYRLRVRLHRVPRVGLGKGRS